MKVKELITELQKCNPELLVQCQYYLPMEPGTDEADLEWFTPTWVQEHTASKFHDDTGSVWIRE